MTNVATTPKQELTTTPADLLAQAVNANLDIDKLEKLMAMKERWDKEQARKAYFSALSDFQIKCPEIRKNKQVTFATQKGTTDYHYAPLGDIDRQIKKTLKECGLSKNWKINEAAGKIKVDCVITHIDGHSETTSMEAESDSTGSKNAIQAKGSAIEYMKRYTLIGALGLTTTDSDIDGRGDYEYDMDKLHRNFMELYNQVIQYDSTLTKFHPDNWLIERTGKNYVKAIGDVRKLLFDLQNKNKK